MKRILSLLLALCCLLSLCACSSGENGASLPAGRPGRPQSGAADSSQTGTGAAVPNYSGKYHRVAITADNWADYFELKEIPLYTVTQGDVIAQVCQNFCVVLREEYLPYLNPNGNYRVEFSFRFDLYIDTMDINTNEGVYDHTDDLFYAVETTKNAVFDRYALPSTAYGGEPLRGLFQRFLYRLLLPACRIPRLVRLLHRPEPGDAGERVRRAGARRLTTSRILPKSGERCRRKINSGKMYGEFTHSANSPYIFAFMSPSSLA